MEEYLDTYDENNNPTGIAEPRSVVHSQGLWHRTVHIYITNDRGEFLVHLRSSYKDSKPNCWDTRFGGHVKAGSDYSSAVAEELQEEIGIAIDQVQLIEKGIFQHNGEHNKEHIKVYFCKYDDGVDTLNFNDSEVVEVKWMSPEQILESMVDNPGRWAGSAKSFKEILEL